MLESPLSHVVGACLAMAADLGVALPPDRIVPTAVIALALAAAHGISLATPSGRRVPLTVAAAAGALLVTEAPFVTMLVGGLVGLPLGFAILVVLRGTREAWDTLPAEAGGYAAFLVVAGVLHWIMPDHASSPWIHLLVTGGSALVWFFCETLIRTLLAGSRRRVGRRLLVRRRLAEWQAFAALVAVGSIFGVTVSALRWWAVPLTAVPYLFAHLALGRAQQTRSTYRQTIRALGRTPEAGGLAPVGYADRTADLAVAMGAELGLSSPELEQIEEAAFLHDIGRLVLSDPAVAGTGYSTRDLAQWSAAIVSEIPHLRPVAELVAEHYRPYRRAGEGRDLTIAPAAQLVKIASAYALAEAGGMSAVDALEVLHQGSAYDYDPRRVAILRNVLVRRGEVQA